MSGAGHETRVESFHLGVKVICSCGWIDRWYGPDDGSAGQSAEAHSRRASR